MTNNMLRSKDTLISMGPLLAFYDDVMSLPRLRESDTFSLLPTCAQTILKTPS